MGSRRNRKPLAEPTIRERRKEVTRIIGHQLLSPFGEFEISEWPIEEYLGYRGCGFRSGVGCADTTLNRIYAPNQRRYAHYVWKTGQDVDQRLKAQREHDVRWKLGRPNCAARRSHQIRKDFHRTNRLVGDALSGSLEETVYTDGNLSNHLGVVECPCYILSLEERCVCVGVGAPIQNEQTVRQETNGSCGIVEAVFRTTDERCRGGRIGRSSFF